MRTTNRDYVFMKMYCKGRVGCGIIARAGPRTDEGSVRVYGVVYIVILICFSLMTSNVFLFMSLLAISIIFLSEVSVQVFCPFKIGLYY